MRHTREFRSSWLINLQSVSWWLFLIGTGAVTLLYLFWPEYGGKFDLYLLALIGAAAVGRLVVIAELFRMARLYRYYALGYLIVVLLLSTILIKRIWP